jgi:hypothetical protein
MTRTSADPAPGARDQPEYSVWELLPSTPHFLASPTGNPKPMYLGTFQGTVAQDF